jgi:hypothetical protein
MNLIIDLTPSEEAQLSEAAKQTGLAPAELVKKLVKEHLPAIHAYAESDLDSNLRKWQEQDGMKLMPDIPTRTLFAQWAEEDALMTNDEREAEDRLWEDLEKGLTQNSRVLQLRRLS